MARYFFHLFNDIVVGDEEGADLPDLPAARDVAIRNIRELMCEAVHAGSVNLSHRIEIADAHGAVLLSVYFREAVDLQG